MKANQFFASRSFHHQERQAIPIADAGVIQPPIPPRRDDDAISQAFSRAREAIRRLEAERLIHVGGEWSPSHHVQK